MQRWVRALLGTILFACGGRQAGIGAAQDAGDDGSNDLVIATCAPAGARLCGGGCGDASPCPGGCSHLLDPGGGTSQFGVCWSDLPDKGATPCALCGDGQGCVQRSPGVFVCVPLAVCGALYALGAGDVCWYGDKVPFDGRRVPTATGCPQPAKIANIVCGGDCPACAETTLDRCVGRGVDHPFGVCPGLAFASDREDLAGVPLCVASSGKDAVPCPSSYEYSCAVFPYPPGELAVAVRSGFCVSAEMCAALATSLPGGLWCFDASGTKVAP